MSTEDGASTTTALPVTADAESEQATPETTPVVERTRSVLGPGRGAAPYQNFAIGVSGRTRRRPTA